MEGDFQFHVVPVQDVGDGGAGDQGVAGIHIDMGDDAAGVGLYLAILGIVVPGADQAVVVELGRLHRELGLFHPGAGLLNGVFHVGGVHHEEDVVLADGVALLKGSVQDLAPNQGGPGTAIVMSWICATAGR